MLAEVAKANSYEIVSVERAINTSRTICTNGLKRKRKVEWIVKNHWLFDYLKNSVKDHISFCEKCLCQFNNGCIWFHPMERLCLDSKESEAFICITVRYVFLLVNTNICCSPSTSMSSMLLICGSNSLNHILSVFISIWRTFFFSLVVSGAAYTHHWIDILNFVTLREKIYYSVLFSYKLIKTFSPLGFVCIA